MAKDDTYASDNDEPGVDDDLTAPAYDQGEIWEGKEGSDVVDRVTGWRTGRRST
jgi:hypothetical protein